MKNLIQTASVILFAASAAQAQQAVQWKASDGGNGHWYQMLANPHGDLHWRWSDAQAFATASGGHLATLTSPSESAAAYNLVGIAATTRTAWIGLYQPPGSFEPAGGWKWVTNEASSHQNWKPGQPGDAGCSITGNHQDYAIIGGGGDNQWDDHGDPTPNCRFDVRSAIIEWSADCNNDGIVDYGQCRDGSLPDFDGDNVPDCCERNEPCTVGYYPRQWRVEDGGNGHWYELVISGPLTWGAARNRAETRGGYLATPTSPAENAFIIPLANHPEAWVEDCCGNTGGPWLGGYQPIGASPQDPWRWVTGEPWDWAGWAPGEPNNGFQPGILVTAMLGYPPLNQNFRGWADGFADGTSPDYPIQFPLDVSFIAEYSADCNNDGIVDYGQILTGQLADLDSNGVPDICQQPTCVDADLFRDFNVNGADLGILLSQWGPSSPLTVSDINSDGVVNGADLGILLSFWGPCD
jgi:hypothetical protein